MNGPPGMRTRKVQGCANMGAFNDCWQRCLNKLHYLHTSAPENAMLLSFEYVSYAQPIIVHSIICLLEIMIKLLLFVSIYPA